MYVPWAASFELVHETVELVEVKRSRLPVGILNNLRIRYLLYIYGKKPNDMASLQRLLYADY